MKSLIDQLANYASYHRDTRNIATHFAGIPMIVLAVAVLLSRPALLINGIALSPAVLVSLIAIGYYAALDLRYGMVMGVLFAMMLWLAHWLAWQSIAMWLSAGIGLFVVGWILQFLGHHYEGRKPAFVDDLMGLAIGPLFVLAEAGFLLGLRNEVRAAIEERVGPTRTGKATVQ
ncbi:MAG: DUF962 domain-containing protein [Lysobacterales bacterium]